VNVGDLAAELVHISYASVEAAPLLPKPGIASGLNVRQDRSVKLAPPTYHSFRDGGLERTEALIEPSVFRRSHHNVHMFWHDDPREEFELVFLPRGDHCVDEQVADSRVTEQR